MGEDVCILAETWQGGGRYPGGPHPLKEEEEEEDEEEEEEQEEEDEEEEEEEEGLCEGGRGGKAAFGM